MTRYDRYITAAAGIRDPHLAEAYALCRQLHARHGRTYYLATLMLPPWKRPYVHALYGFARFADEIVDNSPPATRAQTFETWRTRALTALAAGRTDDPVCHALSHTLRTWGQPLDHVVAFLRAMAADLTVTEYETFEDLTGYMYGSAAVIGLLMLPILEPLHDEAQPRAQALGEAFQLTNFIRDIGEDLGRGRLYLPREDLAAFGVSTADLAATRTTRRVRDLIAFQVHRTREIYAYAAGGIPLLAASSRPCISTAFELYRRILTAVERAGFDILHRRVSVSLPERLGVALPAYVRARRTWAPKQDRT